MASLLAYRTNAGHRLRAYCLKERLHLLEEGPSTTAAVHAINPPTSIPQRPAAIYYGDCALGEGNAQTFLGLPDTNFDLILILGTQNSTVTHLMVVSGGLPQL